MADQKTLTAPKAIIKVGNEVIGKLKNVRLTETLRRGRVAGLGELTPSEAPALEWSGSISASQYAFKLDKSVLNLIDRKFNTVKEFVNEVLFNEGVDVCLLMKIKGADGKVTEDTFATVHKVLLNSEGLDLSEGAIGGRDCSGEYLEPMLFPNATVA